MIAVIGGTREAPFALNGMYRFGFERYGRPVAKRL